MDETLNVGHRMLTSQSEFDRHGAQLQAEAYQQLVREFGTTKLSDFDLDIQGQKHLAEARS